MQQIYINSYFKGYDYLMKYIHNIANHRKRAIIEKRLAIIKFFDEFGSKATKEAFHRGRSTIFLWKQKIDKAGGKLSALAPLDTIPKTRVKRKVTDEMVNFVLAYRILHPGVDKTTIKPVLDAFCQFNNLSLVGEGTIGNIIKELKDKGKLPDYYIKTTINGATGKLRYKRIGTKKLIKLRAKGYHLKVAGDLMQVDAISIFIQGTKRYIICALDIVSRFAFAYSYKTLSSQSAKDFMQKLEQVTLFKIKAVQTDNGGEFHKYFDGYLKERHITHYWNYPRYPKGNAYVENFNGTIQRQYIGWHLNEIQDTDTFNTGLMDYLTWYNTEKPHRSIGKIPPLRYYINCLAKKHNLSLQKSNMLLAGGICLIYLNYLLK